MDKTLAVRIKDAAYPNPFKPGLEFNAPVHGSWNIVHIGMQVPEAHQIYICADNCMRGVIMTAAEMDMLDRISGVVLEEHEMVSEDITTVTLEGIRELLGKFDKLPPAVIVFPVCVHHFLNCDLEYVYSNLEKEFPGVVFIRAFMDPIMQKLHLTPEQTLRSAMLEGVPSSDRKEKTVSVLGCDMPLYKDSEIFELIDKAGYKVREIFDMGSFEEYMGLGSSSLNICNYPTGDLGVKTFSDRCSIPYLYLPFAVLPEEIDEYERRLSDALGIELPDMTALKAELDNALDDLRAYIHDKPVAIDYTAHPRPFGLAYLLLEHGINVRKVYADSVSAEEKDVFERLKTEYPDLLIEATIAPGCRIAERKDSDYLAIGQKAAWFCGTKNFVNIIEGAGLYGYKGLIRLTELIKIAYDNESDTEDIVPRKGLGCLSSI
ncbi:MAG: nitrogenase [Clostridiales bacterium]|nr:nitrogenase [Clostridiales bacterium]